MSADPDLLASSNVSAVPAELREPRTADPQSDSDTVMTRSDEQLHISTSGRETQRARLIKFAETEEKTFTFPVRHEQVRIEYLPIAVEPANSAAAAEGHSSAQEPWLVLYDEEVVVQTRWVPRERVRLVVRSVTEDREVSVDRRREELELDDTTHGG